MASTTGFDIGRFRDEFATNYFSNALVDDFVVFNRFLPAGEILTLYTAGRGALDQRVKVPVVRGVTSSGGTTVTPTTASLALAGFAPSVLTPQTVTPNTASHAANIERAIEVSAATPSFKTLRKAWSQATPAQQAAMIAAGPPV